MTTAADYAFYFDFSHVQATQMALQEKEEAKEEAARKEEAAQKFRCLLNQHWII